MARHTTAILLLIPLLFASSVQVSVSAEIYDYSPEFTVNSYTDFLWRFVQDVDVDDSLIYVLKKNGLEIYDGGIDYRNPELRVRLPLDRQYTTLRVSGASAVVYRMPNEISLIDVSSVEEPEVVWTISTDEDITGFEIADSAAYLCFGFEGLAVYDLSDPSQPERVGILSHGVHIVDADRREDILYVADDFNGLLIYDISDQTDPQLLRIEYLSKQARAIDLSPELSRMFVAFGNDGILAMDLSDPRFPRYADTIPLDFQPTHVNASSGYVAASDIVGRVHVFEVQTGERIRETERLNIAGRFDLISRHGMAYLALPNRQGDLVIEALSIGAEPIEAWSHPGSELIRSVAFTDSAIAVAGGFKDLSFWRVDDAGNAEMIGSLDATTRHSEVKSLGSALVITENSLPENTWVRFFNVLEGCCSLQIGSSHIAYSHVEGMQFESTDSGLIDLAAFGEDGTTLFKIEPVVEPEGTFYLRRAVTFLDLNSTQTALEVADGYVYTYVRKGSGGIFDATIEEDYGPLTEVGTFSVNGTLYSIEIEDSLAFLGGSAGLEIRVMDGPLIGETMTFAVPGFTVTDMEIDTERDLLFAALAEDGIAVLDIEDVLAPVVLAQVDTPGYAEQVEFAEDRILISDRFSVGVLDFYMERPGDGPILPTGFSLRQNYPNPFNNSTVIEFSIPGDAGGSRDVHLEIVNAVGQVVSTIQSGPMPSGPHALRWDGTNSNGERVASGVYLYRLRVGDSEAVRKMVLLK